MNEDQVKFGTYWRDSVSGLDYAQNRYFSASSGRFTTADPYRASAAAANPQTWNRYPYANNDPANLVDPKGRVALTAEYCSANRDDPDCYGDEPCYATRIAENEPCVPTYHVSQLPRVTRADDVECGFAVYEQKIFTNYPPVLGNAHLVLQIHIQSLGTDRFIEGQPAAKDPQSGWPMMILSAHLIAQVRLGQPMDTETSLTLRYSNYRVGDAAFCDKIRKMLNDAKVFPSDKYDYNLFATNSNSLVYSLLKKSDLTIDSRVNKNFYQSLFGWGLLLNW